MSDRMSTRLQVELTEENYQRVVERANYLGTSLTSIILLTFYLYQEVSLEEPEIEKQLEYIQAEKKYFKVAITIVDSLEETLKYKRRYFYTLSEYLSAYLNYLLETKSEGWQRSSEPIVKKSNTFLIDLALDDWISNFAKEIGVGQTTLFNYALTFVKPSKKSYSTKNKKQKGIYLTEINRDFLGELSAGERQTIIENCVLYYQKLEGK